VTHERAVRFVSKGFAGVTLKRGENKGSPILAARKQPNRGQAANLKDVDTSPQLEAIVGSSHLPRAEVISKVWDHIRKNSLQNPKNKREILADDKLRKVFGKDKVSMFEMNKHLSKHMKTAS
jgi:chromatin remodeling complex protein RSC6